MFFSSGTWSRQLDSVVNGVAISVGPDLPVDGPREGCEHHSAVLAHHVHPLVLPPSSEEEQGGLAHSSTLPARNPPLLQFFTFYSILRTFQAQPSPITPAQDLGSLYLPQPWESQPLILFAGWPEQIFAHCAAVARKEEKIRRWNPRTRKGISQPVLFNQ